MIKGKVMSLMWVIEAILLIWMAIGWASGHHISVIPAIIIFFANLMLIGTGSKVDKWFFVYPYGTFLMCFGAGFCLLVHYWNLYYDVTPKTTWCGMHPGLFILWIVFCWIGGVVFTLLPYTLRFKKYVISEKDWEDFMKDAQRFKEGKEIKETEAK
jgi:hypothetical protein